MRRLVLAAALAVPLAAVMPLLAADVEQPLVVRTIAFSPDGKFLVVGFGDKNTPGGLVIWDVLEQRAAQIVRGDRGVSSVAFSPDGLLVALTEYDRPPKVLDAASGKPVATLADLCRGPVAFSPDGSTLVCGANDKTIHLWDVKSWTDRRVLSGAKDRIYSRIVYSPDGSSLLTPCGTAGVYSWNVATGNSQFILSHGRSFTRSGVWTSDMHWIVTGGWDGTVRVWDAQGGTERARLAGMGGVNSLDLLPNGNLLAIGFGKEIRLVDLALSAPSGEDLMHIRALLSRFEDDDYSVRENASAEITKLGLRAEAELKRAAAESPLAEVRIRTRRARQAILAQSLATLTGHQADVWTAVFAPAGSTLASGSDDGTVRLWNVADRTEIACFVPAEISLQP